MNNQEAVMILQKHIDTYRHQLTDGGWEQMMRMGIARNTINKKLSFRADAEKQIQAYEQAIKALESSREVDWVDRCYLGSPCPYQTQK